MNLVFSSSVRPSISPNPSSTSSHKLTSAKLTSVISSKPTTGALSSVPTVGWAKPAARPSPGLSPSTEHTALSSLNPVLLTESPKPTTLGLGSLRRGQLAGPSMGAGMGAGGRIKKEWAPIASGEGYRSGLGREFPTAGEVIEGKIEILWKLTAICLYLCFLSIHTTRSTPGPVASSVHCASQSCT